MGDIADAGERAKSQEAGLAFAWSLGVAAAAAAVQIAAFGVLRSRTWAKRHYSVRVGRPGGPAEPLPDGVFAWLPALLRLSERDVIVSSGGSLDAVVFLRLCILGAKTFLFATVLGMLGLVPVYHSGKKALEQASWLDEVGVGHLDPGEHRFWSPVVFMYFVSAFLLALLWREYAHINKLRIRLGSLASERPGIKEQRRTVLVTDMAPEDDDAMKQEDDPRVAADVSESSASALAQSASSALGSAAGAALRLATSAGGSMAAAGELTAADVKARFEALYPGQVLSAVIALPSTEHGDGSRAWDALDASLASAEVAFARKPGGRTLCCRPVTVETVKAKQDAAYDAMTEAKRALLLRRMDGADSQRRSVTAFVFFSSAAAAFQASHALVAADGKWNTRPAPFPSEVQWAALELRWWERYSRSLLVGALLTAFTALFMIPLTFVSGAANLTALSQQWDWLGSWYLDLPEAVTSLLEGLLPSIILIVFFMLCPPLLYATASFMGVVSKADATTHVLGWMFAIMTVSVMWSVVAQALFSQVNGLADALDFATVIELLATGVPAGASLLIQFVIIKTVGGLPGEILGVVPLLIRTATRRFAATHRQLAEAEAPAPAPYAEQLPNLLLLLFIGLVYMALQPVVSPFVCVGCLLTWLVFRHQLVYVYEPESETTGALFLVVFSRVIVSLQLAHVVLLAVLFFGEAWPQLICTVPLPLAAAFVSRVAARRFQASFEVIPLDSVTRYDALEAKEVSLQEWKAAYRPPWLAAAIPELGDGPQPSDGEMKATADEEEAVSIVMASPRR